MNQSNDDLDALFAKARVRRADTSRAEYGFETRLLARLRAEEQETWSWDLIAWRMIPFFVAVVLVLGLVNMEFRLDAEEAEFQAGTANPEIVDLWNTFS